MRNVDFKHGYATGQERVDDLVHQLMSAGGVGVQQVFTNFPQLRNRQVPAPIYL